MTDLDCKIEEALTEEDRALMQRFGEQGIFSQLAGLFEGKTAWLSVVSFMIGLAAFGVGVYAGWKFAMASDAAMMLRWGGLAWVAFITLSMLKIWAWMRMESNRVLREVKRVELQVARGLENSQPRG